MKLRRDGTAAGHLITTSPSPCWSQQDCRRDRNHFCAGRFDSPPASPLTITVQPHCWPCGGLLQGRIPEIQCYKSTSGWPFRPPISPHCLAARCFTLRACRRPVIRLTKSSPPQPRVGGNGSAGGLIGWRLAPRRPPAAVGGPCGKAPTGTPSAASWQSAPMHASTVPTAPSNRC